MLLELDFALGKSKRLQGQGELSHTGSFRECGLIAVCLVPLGEEEIAGFALRVEGTVGRKASSFVPRMFSKGG